MLSPSILEKEEHIANDEKLDETDENTIDNGNEDVNKLGLSWAKLS